MLPKDVSMIIDHYNEPGVFVIIDNKIQWFNGGRFEYWCNYPKFGRTIATYQNNLYLRIYAGILIYKNGFMPIRINKEWDELRIFGNRKYVQEVFFNGCVYGLDWVSCGPNLKFTMFNGKKTIKLPDKPTFSTMKMIIYKTEIFVFGPTQNEKFDVIRNCWFPFAGTPDIHLNDVYLFKDRLYATDYKNLYVYDPVKDYWENSPI